MCGIAGVMTTTGRLVPEATAAALAALAHRGPDGEGLETFDAGAVRCALGHRRLAILDLSPAGKQPMAGAAKSAWITYNGEIYNYVELKDELGKLGHTFSTRTDTEVLLAAWREWGEAMLSRLNGMFAFAIWDVAKARLFLARDRFGEKPLHWKEHAGNFVFASELRAIRAFERHGQIPASPIDEGWLYRFLQFGRMENDDTTMLDGVRRLPPGHRMLVSAAPGGGLTVDIARWYGLEARARNTPATPDPAARFKELFDDSVRIRLRADVPVGTSLSGGIDSASVVTTMAAALSDSGEQHTFTCRMEDERLDEGPFSSETARAARARVHDVKPTADDLARDFDRLVVAQGEPFQTGSLYAQWRVFELAKKDSVTVLLDGQGADEILAGYGTFTAIATAQRLARGRFGAARAMLAAAPENLREQTRRESREYAFRGLLGDAMLRVFERWRFPRGARSATLVSRDARLRYGRPRRLRPRLAGASWLDAWLQYATTEGPLQMLLRFADRNSMAHSREVRLPFLDHRIVELCFSLPDEWKIGNGWTKRLLRDAMAGRVPEKVRLRRDKVGFEAPDVLWLTGPLRPWMVERAESAIRRFDGLVDASAARSLLAQVTPEHPGRAIAIATLFPWISADASARELSR